MLGGEFEHHGAQQDAKILIADKTFGPIADLQEFQFVEEWYIVKNLAPDMHVILYQDTTSMSGQDYKTLKPYPETWRGAGEGANTPPWATAKTCGKNPSLSRYCLAVWLG